MTDDRIRITIDLLVTDGCDLATVLGVVEDCAPDMLEDLATYEIEGKLDGDSALTIEPRGPEDA